MAYMSDVTYVRYSLAVHRCVHAATADRAVRQSDGAQKRIHNPHKDLYKYKKWYPGRHMHLPNIVISRNTLQGGGGVNLNDKSGKHHY